MRETSLLNPTHFITTQKIN